MTESSSAASNEPIRLQGVPKRCLYCLGEPDHQHIPTHACGHCCSMHGGLTVSDNHAYGWVEEIIKTHNEVLGTAEAQVETLTRERDALQQFSEKAFDAVDTITAQHSVEWHAENDKVAGLRAQLADALRINSALRDALAYVKEALEVSTIDEDHYGTYHDMMHCIDAALTQSTKVPDAYR